MFGVIFDRRLFTFRGEFQHGAFHGALAELYRGRERQTATLVLRA